MFLFCSVMTDHKFAQPIWIKDNERYLLILSVNWIPIRTITNHWKLILTCIEQLAAIGQILDKLAQVIFLYFTTLIAYCIGIETSWIKLYSIPTLKYWFSYHQKAAVLSLFDKKLLILTLEKSLPKNNVTEL